MKGRLTRRVAWSTLHTQWAAKRGKLVSSFAPHTWGTRAADVRGAARRRTKSRAHACAELGMSPASSRCATRVQPLATQQLHCAKHYARSIIASFMSGSHTSENNCSPHLMVSTTDRIAPRAQKEEIRPALALPRTGGLWQICAEPWSTAAGSITAHAYDTPSPHSYLLSAPHDTDERDRWQ